LPLLLTGTSALSQGELCVTNDLDLLVTVPLQTVNNDDIIAIHCGMTLGDVTQLRRPISGVPAVHIKTKQN